MALLVLREALAAAAQVKQGERVTLQVPHRRKATTAVPGSTDYLIMVLVVAAALLLLERMEQVRRVAMVEQAPHHLSLAAA